MKVVIKNYFSLILSISFLFSGALENKIHTLYTDAVVEIHNIIDNKVATAGTGFLIDKKGLIVTNAHVIENAESIIVITKDNEQYQVTDYYQINNKKDYAILKINPKGKIFKILHLGNSKDIKVGDDVIAVGNPMGYKYTVTSGIVSAKRIYDNIEYLQIDADIAPGSSGGPLFNYKEEVIGITTSGIVGYSGLNFAIPINYIKKVLDYNLPLISFSEIKKENLSANNFSSNQTKNNIPKGYWSTPEGEEIFKELLLECTIRVSDADIFQNASQIYGYCSCEIDVLIQYFDFWNTNTNSWPKHIEDKIDQGYEDCYSKYK